MNLVVTSRHRSTYPNPISFQPGEKLQLGGSDREYPGWIWVTTNDGNQGWAPEQYLAIHDCETEATASQEYSARELDTEAGEKLELLEELNQWVYARNAKGAIGWVPLETTTPAE